MTSGPIISCQIDGETMKTGTDFIVLSSKITVDGVCCSHEIKRCLLLERKTLRIKKQRHYFAYKDLYSQSYGFSSSLVWMGELDNKKKLSAKELMTSNCGAGEDLRIPSTARRSNQSILKEISPEYSLEGLVLKLKLQYFAI